MGKNMATQMAGLEEWTGPLRGEHGGADIMRLGWPRIEGNHTLIKDE